MTLPLPPTDNIYKFLALSGTIILVLSLYIPIQLRLDLQDKLDQLDLKIGSSEVIQEDLSERVSLLKEIVDNSISEQKGQRLQSKDKLTIRYSEEEIKSILREIAELKQKTNLAIKETRILHSQEGSLVERIKVVSSMSWWGVFVGGLVACIGYILWYKRVQVHLDNAVKEYKT